MRPGGGGGEGGNTKEESLGCVRNTKRIHGRKRADRRESKYTAGENIGPRFAIQYTRTCARDVTRVWHVFLRLQSCRFHAYIHIHARTHTPYVHMHERMYTYTRATYTYPRGPHRRIDCILMSALCT